MARAAYRRYDLDMADDDDGVLSDLPRNFAIPLAERVRAQEGLPAHIYRHGIIEQLIARHLRELRAVRHDPDALARCAAGLDLARLNALIDNHNRYYPIEANLPIDPDSGGSRGFQPLEEVTLEWLLVRL
jgi:hypothetical protein